MTKNEWMTAAIIQLEKINENISSEGETMKIYE